MGVVVADDEDLSMLSFLDSPEAYDSLLQANFYVAQHSAILMETPWTQCALLNDSCYYI